jgi:hypothetical protein
MTVASQSSLILMFIVSLLNYAFDGAFCGLIGVSGRSIAAHEQWIFGFSVILI